MSNINVGQIFFEIGADTKKLNQASKEIKTFSQAARKNLQNSNRAFNRLNTSITKNTQAMRKLTNAFKSNKISKEIDRTTKSTKKLNKNLENTKKSLTNLGKAFLGLFALQKLKQFTLFVDEFEVLNNRIRFITRDTNNYVEAQQRLINATVATGTGLKANVLLYQNLTRASSQLGATQEDILKVTEAVTQLGVIGGSTPQDIKFALRQLAQGFSGVILRAEEFHSVNENTPEIISRIARGLNVTKGQLTNMVLTGKVLSKDVFAALLKQTEQIKEDFQTIPVGFRRGIESLTTAIGEYFAVISENSEVLGNFGAGLAFIAQRITGYTATIKDNRTEVEKLTDKIAALKEEKKELDQAMKTAVPDFMASITGLKTEKDITKDQKAINDEIIRLQKELNAELAKEREAERRKKQEDLKREQQILFNTLDKSAEIIREAEEESQRNARLNALKGLDIVKDSYEAQLEEQIKFLEKQAKNMELGEATREAILKKSIEKEKELRESQDKITLTQKTQLAKGIVDIAKGQTEQLVGVSKEAFELNKAFTIASILLDTPRAVSSSYAKGSEIGGHPLGVIYAALAAAQQGVQLGVARGATFSGKAGGGMVNAEQTFRVNERGPEMLSIGNKDFLMMGNQSGNITPANKINPATGSKGVVVNVYNAPGTEARTESSTDAEGNQQLDIIIKQVDQAQANGIRRGDNAVSRALSDVYALNRGARARI